MVISATIISRRRGILGIFDTLADRFHLQPDEIEDLILSHSPDQLSEDHPGDSRFSPADDSIPAGTEDVAAIMQSYQVELINWIDGIHRVLLMFGGRQDRINQILAYGDGFTYPGTADMLRHRIRSDIQVIESISSWNASKRSDRLGSGTVSLRQPDRTHIQVGGGHARFQLFPALP